MNEKLSIYLSSPYSHGDPAIRQARYEAALHVTAKLMSEGHAVFSPIVHCHPMAINYALPTDYEYWKKYNEDMIWGLQVMYVLMIDGWRESKGVQAEIKNANSIEKPVEYINENGEHDVYITDVAKEIAQRLINSRDIKSVANAEDRTPDRTPEQVAYDEGVGDASELIRRITDNDQLAYQAHLLYTRGDTT